MFLAYTMSGTCFCRIVSDVLVVQNVSKLYKTNVMHHKIKKMTLQLKKQVLLQQELVLCPLQ